MKTLTLLESDFTSKNTTRDFEFISDEPIEKNGKNLGPTPMEYLCGALGSCTTITLQMYFQRKEWDIESISVEVEKTNTEHDFSFSKIVSIKGGLTEDQLKRVKHISSVCPINKLLTKGAEIETKIILL